MRGGQHVGIDLAVGHRHHHDNLADSGNFRRDGVHQHRRRVRGLAARDIDTDPVERCHHLPQLDIRLILGKPGLFLLFAMECSDPFCGQPQPGHSVVVDSRKGLVDLLFCDLEFVGIELETIKPLSVFTEGHITPCPHIGKNLLNSLQDILRGCFATHADVTEALREVCIGKTQKTNHGVSLNPA